MKLNENELNKNLNSLLNEGETITWTSIPKRHAAFLEALLVLIIPIVFLLIIIVTQIIVFSFALKDTNFVIIPIFIFSFADLIFLSVFGLILFSSARKSKITRFVLTNERIIITNCEATLIKMQSNLCDIHETKLIRSPTDRIVKVGDIQLFDSNNRNFIIFDIPEYDAIYKRINQIVSNKNEEIKSDEFVRLKRCSYCGSSYFDDNNVCPYCGGHN